MGNERRNTTQPADWWDAFERAARKAGQTLSEWVGEQCKAALPKKEAKSLSKRPPAHRPKKSKE